VAADQTPESGNWGAWVIQQVIHPLAIFLAPAILLVVMTYFVVIAFDAGFGAGIRSFAAVLLPLSLVAFLFIFQREWLMKLEAPSAVISFLAALAVGVLVMAAIRLAARSPAVPITELVLSTSFALLVFSHAGLRGTKISAYSYGMLSGIMLYIIVLGFPALR
jgi:hypothetical protein